MTVRRPAAAALPAASPAPVGWAMRRLAKAIDGLDLPAVEKISESQQDDPFRVLIATLLSAQTMDAVTHAASLRLFAAARTPRTMAKLPVEDVERLIFPVGFYRNKARFVLATCEAIVKQFGGRTPTTLEELVTLPGVGRKTATLVMIIAFKSQKHICVDTHVHRIANRLGWVATREPAATEEALYTVVPRRWWPLVNLCLVTWGQNICRPVYPRCGECVLAPKCPKIGVTRVGKSRGLIA